MDYELITWIAGIAVTSTLGIGFMVKTLVTSGIQKAVELNFNKHLETYKTALSKELESLKSTLKNSEVFFVRQLEALSMLRSLFRKIVPERSFPDAEWDEALEHISDNYRKHLQSLNEYLCSYDAVLPSDVRSQLEDARYALMEIRFQFEVESSTLEPIPSKEALENANVFYDLLAKSIQQFQGKIEQQLGNKAASLPPPKIETA